MEHTNSARLREPECDEDRKDRGAPSPVVRAPDMGDQDESRLFDALSRAAQAAQKTGEDLWLGHSAPRYTSYPPATAFTTDVGAAAYQTALLALNPADPVSVYLHIPFCKSTCLYCGCNTAIAASDARVDDYLDAMKREIAMTHLLAGAPRRLSRMHFGGGSPNMMTPRAVDDLFGFLHRHFDFSDAGEIAMELDPRRIGADFLARIVAAGVRRISLGVQDLNPDVQRAIRRVQDETLIARVCDEIRAAGVRQINFDLIYGLPLQTPESIAHTARRVVALGPDRIALYSYAHVPQMKKQQRALEAYGLPGKYTQIALERAARAVFMDAGYVAIGMDHFARPTDPLARAAASGQLRRNFQGYTDDGARALLAFGASSISRTPAGFFQSERDPRFYEKKIKDDRTLPTVRGLLLGGQDAVRAAIIESLMCQMRVDLAAVCAAHDYAPGAFAAELDALKPFEDAGVVQRQGTMLRLAIPDRMAMRVIAQIFDEKAASGIASRAV